MQRIEMAYDRMFKKSKIFDSRNKSTFGNIMGEYLGTIYDTQIRCMPVKISFPLYDNKFIIELFDIEYAYKASNKGGVIYEYEAYDSAYDKIVKKIKRMNNDIDFFKYNYDDLSCHNFSEDQVKVIDEIFTWFYISFSAGAEYWFYPCILKKEGKIYGILVDGDSNRIITGFGDPFPNILRHNPVYFQIWRYLTISYFQISDSTLPLSNIGLSEESMQEAVRACIAESVFISFGLQKTAFYSMLLNANYESTKNLGAIRYFLPYHEQESYLVEDNTLVAFSNRARITLDEGEIRKIRKILQMSSEEMPLTIYKIEDDRNKQMEWTIVGIGGEYNNEPLCTINFINGVKWECIFRNEKIVYDGIRFKMSRMGFKGNEEKCNKFNTYALTRDNASLFAELVEKLQKQKHGTMLIISSKAESEVKRLEKCGRAIGVAKINFFNNNQVVIPDELSLLLSNIDGAILINEEAECFGIGVILDGVAIEGANIGRGARYNSAYTYVCNRAENECVAVIISEDETVDILPQKNE